MSFTFYLFFTKAASIRVQHRLRTSTHIPARH